MAPDSCRFKVRIQRGKNINSLSTTFGDLIGPVGAVTWWVPWYLQPSMRERWAVTRLVPLRQWLGRSRDVSKPQLQECVGIYSVYKVNNCALQPSWSGVRFPRTIWFHDFSTWYDKFLWCLVSTSRYQPYYHTRWRYIIIKYRHHSSTSSLIVVIEVASCHGFVFLPWRRFRRYNCTLQFTIIHVNGQYTSLEFISSYSHASSCAPLSIKAETGRSGIETAPFVSSELDSEPTSMEFALKIVSSCIRFHFRLISQNKNLH